MAERKVTGGDILFYIDPAGGTDWSLVICLTNQSYSRSTDEIDAATKCGPDTQPGKQTQSVSIEGQLMLDPGTDRLGISALHDLWEDKTQFAWKYGEATPTTGSVTYAGIGYFSKLDETADLDNPASFSATVGLIGSVTKTVTPP